MKILYAIQATGNGHISRASELLPSLGKYGEVDVFLSGNNSNLNFPFPVKYRSKGISLAYNSNGGIDYFKTFRNICPIRIQKEIRELPLEKYDIILNDFECITSLSCKNKKISSLHFGHQASFAFQNTPRPEKKNILGEWILQNYAVGSSNLGLHFWSYSPDILTPVIRKTIRQAQPKELPYICVYLNQYSLAYQIEQFQVFKDYQFQIFSKEVVKPLTIDNIVVFPIENSVFTESLVNCSGIITGAGFETPAEALFLGKKIMLIPIQGQYEQLCNAEALKEWKVLSVKHLQHIHSQLLENWLTDKNQAMYQVLHTSEDIAEIAIEKAIKQRRLLY